MCLDACVGLSMTLCLKMLTTKEMSDHTPRNPYILSFPFLKSCLPVKIFNFYQTITKGICSIMADPGLRSCEKSSNDQITSNSVGRSSKGVPQPHYKQNRMLHS